MAQIIKGKVSEQTDGNHTWHLQEIYKDLEGNTWKQLVDLDTLPAKRYAWIDNKQTYLEIGIDKYDMHSAFKMIDDLVLSGVKENIEQVPKITAMLRDRVDFDFNANNILDLSSSMYVINDEKIYQPSDYFDKIKLEAFSKDADCKSFFLTLSFEIAKTLSAKYSQYSKDSLKDLIIKENLWKNHFGHLMQKIK